MIATRFLALLALLLFCLMSPVHAKDREGEAKAGPAAAIPEHRLKVLFIDDAFLREVHNLTRRTNQAVKHPEPVFVLDAPWDTPEDMFNYSNVLYDEQRKLFRLWYCVCKLVKGQYNEGGRLQGYAESRDGIHWERPILDMVEVNGSRQNNYFLPFFGSFIGDILEDPSDMPARRFKMMFVIKSSGGEFTGGGQTGHNETQWAKFHNPVCLAYSADGLRWDVPESVNPVLRGVADGVFGFMYDRDRRVYQLYTRRVPNLPRDISLYESHDLVNWEDRGRILVAPDERDPPELYNLQGFIPFVYEDFCLGLLNAQYSLPGAEFHEVFNKPPAGYPAADLMGKLNLQLAYSRDGREWLRAEDRSPLIDNGPPGSPDAGCIFPACSSPLVIDGETWIYYVAYPGRHNNWSQEEERAKAGNDARKLASLMLAKMPEDHWVSLDAGATEGWVLTRPSATPSRLLVNADAKGGYIEAELVTPYGETVKGFTRADCIGISGDGKDQEIKWKTSANPRSSLGKYRGGLCLKFYLKNAKFYSYSMTVPDPDGAIERYWDNARWNEAIMHRSDNWDRSSNEPAKGLPQPPGTQFPSGTRYGPNPRAKAKWSP